MAAGFAIGLDSGSYGRPGGFPWQQQRRCLLLVYWYNGTVYGTEIARGFDTFGLLPSDHLSANEIEAASEVHLAEFNAQHQTFIAHTPSFPVTRSYFDQAVRGGSLNERDARFIAKHIDLAEKLADKDLERVAAQILTIAASKADDAPSLEQALRDHANELS